MAAVRFCRLLGILLAIGVLAPFRGFSQVFTDPCFTTPSVGTTFAPTVDVRNNNSDLLRWTGSAWTGGWPGANITLAPPGSIVNTRAIWSGDGTVWTTGGEGFGLRLVNPIVTGTTYTFSFTRVSHGTGQNGNFAPRLYTNTTGTFGTLYGPITGVGTAWTTTSITFTAVSGSNGHTYVYFHNQSGSGMFLACPAVVLPMGLSDFRAYPVGETVNLEWKIQDEPNYAWHVVERAYGSGDFMEIGRNASVQADHEGHVYQFKDISPAMGQERFYRIRSIDSDGNDALSPVISVRAMEPASMELALMPNPVQIGEPMQLSFYAADGAEAMLSVMDQQGRVVAEMVRRAEGGKNTWEIPTAEFLPGVYWFSLKVEGKVGLVKGAIY